MADAFASMFGHPGNLIERHGRLICRMQVMGFGAEQKRRALSLLRSDADLIKRLARAGWSEREMWGIDPANPIANVAAHGVLTSLIISEARGRITQIGPEHARIRWKGVRKSGIHPRRMHSIESLPLWECNGGLSAGAVKKH
jgi:hypothetical protein